ncbi:WD repeat domain-containing protein [Pycnococcus provasolii]
MSGPNPSPSRVEFPTTSYLLVTCFEARMAVVHTGRVLAHVCLGKSGCGDVALAPVRGPGALAVSSSGWLAIAPKASSTITVRRLPTADAPAAPPAAGLLGGESAAFTCTHDAHGRAISSMCFAGPSQLVSASRDAIVVHLLSASKAMNARVISVEQGSVEAMAADETGAAVAAACGTACLVFDLVLGRCSHRLEGHRAAVSAVCFLPHAPTCIATAAEDKALRVWDVRGKGKLLCELSSLSGDALTAVAADPNHPRIAVGDAGGSVRLVDVSDAARARALPATDVGRLVRRAYPMTGSAGASQGDEASEAKPRVVRAGGTAATRREPSSTAAGASGGGWGAVAPPALGVAGNGIALLAFTASPPPLGRSTLSLLSANAVPHLIVGTPAALSILDARSFDLGACFPLGLATTGGAEVKRLAAAHHPQAAAATTQAYITSTRASASVSGADEVEIGGVERELSVLSVGEITGSALVFASYCPPTDDAADNVDAVVAIGGAFTPSAVAIALRCRPSAGNSSLEADARDEVSNGVHGVAHTDGDVAWIDDTGGELDGDVLDYADESEHLCSIFPTEDLDDSSPLRYMPTSSSSSPSSSSTAGRSAATAARLLPGKKSSVVKNLPVTFHRTVRSSGYGAGPPPPRLFGGGPSTRAARSARAKKAGAGGGGGGGGVGSLAISAYPMNASPPSVLATPPVPGEASVHATAALRVAFAPDGSRLATAGADGTARCLKLPLSKHRGAGTDLVGHDGPVLDVRWSHDGRWMLTASTDRSAMLWPSGRPDAVLRIRYQTRSPPATAARAAGKSLTPADAPMPLAGEVRAARLMHLDRLIFLAEGSRARVYAYSIPDEKDRDDIARLRQMAAGGSYKCRACYTSQSQSITDAAVTNGFVSHIAVLATSAKSIEVLDLAPAAPRVVRRILDAHDRAPHCVSLAADACGGVAHPSGAYELFATSSSAGGPADQISGGIVKLWDLRARGCCRTLSSHSAGSTSGGAGLAGPACAFSPCLRYLAVGSDDRAAYVYDIGTGAVVERLRGGHSGAVSGVAWHPSVPRLATCGYDGHVRLWTPESSMSR